MREPTGELPAADKLVHPSSLGGQANTEPPNPIRLRVRFAGSFGRTWLLTLILVALAFPFCTLGFVHHWDDVMLHWANGLYQRKSISSVRAAESGQPRLIIVGGSGALFGIDAELIERKLGIPAVNFGTHAGLGTRYILTRIRRELRPRDRVLIAMEFELICNADSWRSSQNWMALTFDKKYFTEISPFRSARSLYTVPLTDYARSAKHFGNRRRGELDYRGYPSELLSLNGDLRYAYEPPAHEVAASEGVPLPEPEMIQLIREFCEWAKEQDIEVLGTWANQCVADDTIAAARWEASVEAHRPALASAGVTVISPAAECHFPRSLFIDTVYHPTSSARRIRTEHLIRRLRPILKAVDPPPGSKAEHGVLYVMRSPDHTLSAGNLFADNDGVQFKCVVDGEPTHPDLLSEHGLAKRIAGGQAVFCNADDKALEAVLSRLQLTVKPHATAEVSLAELLLQYPNHVFLAARTGADPWPGAGLTSLPQRFSDAMGKGGCFTVIQGSGKYANIGWTLHGKKVEREIRIGSTVEGGWRTPVELLLRANETAATIRVNNVKYSASGSHGLTVVVLDPEMGIIRAAETFDRQLRKTAWQVNQIVPLSEMAPFTK